MTNAEKFKEVFGKEIDLTYLNECIFLDSCDECVNLHNNIDSPSKCCVNWWQSEYQGTPTKTDLISKEEALELFPLILSGELLSIATVREQLRKLQTVEAVPLSVIEKITTEIEERATYEGIYLDRADVLEIIDKAVKECTHE